MKWSHPSTFPKTNGSWAVTHLQRQFTNILELYFRTTNKKLIVVITIIEWFMQFFGIFNRNKISVSSVLP